MWKDYVDLIYEKTLAVVERNGDRIPYTTDGNGRYDDQTDRNISWWTNGFWAGQLWQLYHYLKHPLLLKTAQAIEEKLDKALMDAGGMDHDSGFKWLPTAWADHKVTKSEKSLNRVLLAASNLAGRFNPNGNFIRAWNDGDGQKAGWAIIDSLMNLPLLYNASKVTGDPRFAKIALLHAGTVLDNFVREDGSCEHIVVFDPDTGARVRTLAGQGQYAGSAWSRGQAWALYGFTLTYMHTREERFLDAAKRVAKFFLANIPRSGLIPADFRQGIAFDYEDDSAAAIAASGLLHLANQTGNGQYLAAAERLIKALAENRCDFSPESDYLLTRCTVSFDAERHDHPLIYGDYFFTEAVLKHLERSLMIW